MIIRPLAPPDIPAAKAFLKTHINSSLFMLSNLERAGCEYKNALYQGQYWASFTSDNTINGLIAHYWNGNIMVQAPDNDVLFALQQTAYASITRPVGGFIGPDTQIDYLVSRAPFAPMHYAKDNREDLYVLPLSNLILPPLHTTDLRHARLMDASLFKQWIIAYDQEALGYDHARATTDADARYERLKQGDDLWALYLNDIPVSLCGLNAKTAHTVQVGPVWTPPEHRGQSYARMAVGIMLQSVHKTGIEKAVLFTENPAAVRAYTALGFVLAGGFKLALLHKESFLKS